MDILNSDDVARRFNDNEEYVLLEDVKPMIEIIKKLAEYPTKTEMDLLVKKAQSIKNT